MTEDIGSWTLSSLVILNSDVVAPDELQTITLVLTNGSVRAT